MEEFFADGARTRVVARAFTLEEAVAHVRALLAAPPEVAPRALRHVRGRSNQFYGEDEHRAVKDFVLEMTAALTEANASLRRRGGQVLTDPPSKPRMLDFLRKAQAEMKRRRDGSPRRAGVSP